MSAPAQSSPPVQKLAYRLDEVAELCSMSKRKVQRAVAAGQLEALKDGNVVLVRPKAIEEWLDNMPSWGE